MEDLDPFSGVRSCRLAHNPAFWRGLGVRVLISPWGYGWGTVSAYTSVTVGGGPSIFPGIMGPAIDRWLSLQEEKGIKLYGPVGDTQKIGWMLRALLYGVRR